MTRSPLEIRVVAPSLSYGEKRKYAMQYSRAKSRLEARGYRVTYGSNIKNVMHFGTASREERADDFNQAYRDANVDIIIALSGGWSCNEILPYIDWEVLRKNPKPLVGFSDISVLLNAIYAKTGGVGYLGPTFSRLGQMVEWRYSLDAAQAVWRQDGIYQPSRSKRCGESRADMKNTPLWRVLCAGRAEAIGLGGNLGSLFLLPGTEYCPTFDKPFIWAMEDDDESGRYTAMEVSRRFEAWLQQPGFRKYLAGLIIGRFQVGSRVSRHDIESIVLSKNLGNIPVLYDLDFGHTLPMMTLPIGGVVRIDTARRALLTILPPATPQY